MFTAKQMTALYLTAQMSTVPFRGEQYETMMADYREVLGAMDHAEFMEHCEQSRTITLFRFYAKALTRG